MIRQSIRLIRLRLLGWLGLNEILHGKDQRKSIRMTILLVAYLLVAAMVMFSAASLAFLLCFTGAGKSVPVFLAALSSAVIFVFSLFKAGPVLFDAGDLEQLSALPVFPSAVIVSRFFSLYAGALLLAAGTTLPSCLVYCLMEQPGWGFLLLALAGIPFIPLIPLAAACLLGSAVMAASAGMKHKRVVTLVITLALSLAVVCLSFGISFYSRSPEAGELAEMELAGLLEKGMAAAAGLYPPAGWYASGVTGENPAGYVAFLFSSVGVAAVFVAVVQKYFRRIAGALREKKAKGSFRMEGQRQNTVLAAVYRRELRRYFSSNVYVMNTMIGFLLMLAAAVGLAVLGPDGLQAALGLSVEQAEKLNAAGMIRRELPFFIALVGCMGNTTPVSVSMEGKQLWLIQCLPVSSRSFFLGKILVNLTFAVPSALLSGVILAASGWMNGPELFMIPVCFAFFTSAVGVWMNAKMPVFDWNTETEAVKQSGSMMLTMLICSVAVVPGALFAVFLTGWPLLAAECLTAAALVGAGLRMLESLGKSDLRRLG